MAVLPLGSVAADDEETVVHTSTATPIRRITSCVRFVVGKKAQENW